MITILNKNAFCAILVFFSFIPMNAIPQSSDWEWVRAFGGKGADEINSACNDIEGNLYIAGYFQYEINLDGIKLKSKGDNDILIAKFSNKGNLLWAKQAGGTYSENLIISEYAKKIVIDSDGNIIVAGCFMWEADFDGKLLKGPGNTDIFIVKYSQSGKLVWAKSFGSQQHDFFYDMDIDDKNNIFLTGNLTGSFEKDSSNMDFKGADYEGPGTTPFIAGLNSEGNLKWMRRDIGKADKTLIKVDRDRIYYAEEFSSDLLMSDAYHSVSGNKDFIVQCLTPDGNVKWQRKFSSDQNDIIESLDIGSNGSVLISGKYGNVPEFKYSNGENIKNDLRTYFSKLGPDGSTSWTVNNDSPTFPGGTKFSVLCEDFYFSTDVYSKEINIEGYSMIPDGKWFNSYIALLDKSGKTEEILLNTPGIIKSVIPLNETDYYVSGSFLSSSNPIYQRSGEGGFLDFFIGLRKLPIVKETIAVSQENNPLDSEVIVYPNPAMTSFTVTVNNLAVIERINITNQEGKLMRHFNECKIPFTIDIQDFAAGTYYISLVNQGVIVSKKLVVDN